MPSIFDNKHISIWFFMDQCKEEGPYEHLNLSEIIKLLKEGSDIEATDKYYRTPLLKAAYLGHLESCEEILKLGANIDAQGSGENTALMYGAINENADICKFFIEAGADVSKCNYDGANIYFLAAASGLTDICIMLLDKGLIDINCTNTTSRSRECGATALMYAAMGPSTGCNCSSQPETCKALIAAGIDVNMTDNLECSALYHAVESDRPGTEETAKILMEAGADICSVSSWGTNILWRAAYSDLKDVCKLLIEKGADVPIVGEPGQCNNALKEAGKSFHYGARSGITMPYTTLMLAASEACNSASIPNEGDVKRYMDICRLLVEAGSDVNASTERGTAWSIVKEWENEEVLKMLEELGSNPQ